MTFASLVGAAAGAAAIVVTDRLLRLGAWVVFTWPAVGTLNPYSTWGQRAIAAPLAIAALVVARARPESQERPVPRVPVTH